MAQFDFDAHASGAELKRTSRVDVDWIISGGTIRLVATGLPFHSYGNPLAATTPASQNYDVAFVYRGGQNSAGKHEAVGTGAQGWWLNGVAVFSPSAANGAPTNHSPVKGYTFNTGYQAALELGYTFSDDNAGGHATSAGVYHYRDFNFATAWTTGNGATTGSAGIAEVNINPYLAGSLTHTNGHSKILGFALDGYPIYGPYGYNIALDADSGVSRMASGYALKTSAYRDGAATNLTTYPMGMFLEDFEHRANGDLDKHNGRYCVTPDYPTGTYAYFVTVDSEDVPVYPYVLGTTFYGTPTKLAPARPAVAPSLAGAPVSSEAAQIAIQVVETAKVLSEETPRITWITPKGNLGTYAENSELSIQLSANNPLVDSALATAFDPRLSVVTNNNGTMQVTIPSTKHQLDIVYKPGLVAGSPHPDAVGDVSIGTFPNPLTPYIPAAKEYKLEYPYRGGRNEEPKVLTAVRSGQIGISAVGIPLYGPGIGAAVEGANSTVWNINGVAANINGRDVYGGWVDRFGVYRYQDSRFVTNNAWGKIKLFSGGYRHRDGHSRLIGWAADGYPIYGPYGYVNPKDVGEVRLMVSGYSLATNRNRPEQDTAVVVRGNKNSNRVTLDSRDRIRPGMRIDTGSFPPGSIWVVSVFNNDIILNQTVTIEAGQVLRGYWPAGMFLEDWKWSGTTGATLDRHNGRFCITPEFPGGTYAYFTTQDANGAPTFPYIIGDSFKGSTEISSPPVAGVADLSGSKATQSMTWTVVSGALPSGTQLYRNTGLIYGNPIVLDAKTNVPQRYSFTVRAQNTAGLISDRAFTIDINNITPPVLVDAPDPITNIVDLGTYFDSEPIEVALEYTDTTPGQTLTWSVSRGTIPYGLALDQTGTIAGFALAPAAGGAAGTGGYDTGVYDQFVYDPEGSTLTKTYQFTVRLYDGINFAEKRYQMTILAKSYFRADNNELLVSVDDVYDEEGTVSSVTIFRADKDGFVYPTLITPASTMPTVKQDRAFAFKFDAYYPNPNFTVKYELSNSPADQFGETPFDSVNYDSATLSLPAGLTLDTTTGWLTGLIPIIDGAYEGKQYYDFQVRAYVEVPIDLVTVDRRYSQPIQYRLNVLSAAENLITWTTPADLGTIDNGRISLLALEASAFDGQALTYSLKSTMKELIAADPSDQRIVAGAASRLPQGLKLLETGLISGRTSFDFFSMDRYEQAELTLDKKSTSLDAIFTFVVQATTADGVSFGTRTFTLKVSNINRRPFESLYMRSLAAPDVRKVFHSVLDDTDLTGMIYRADDPFFGIPKTLSFLAVPGLKADTPAAYVQAMAKYHMNKEINFGDLKTAVATDDNLNPIYEVLYVEVKEPGNPQLTSNAVSRVYTDMAAISTSLSVESNTLENMKQAMVSTIGYEYQGALPDWMINLQPDTKRPLGFIRAVVLGYANVGEVQKLKVAFMRSLVRGSFGFTTMFGQFNFVADRYQWDRALSTNYNATTKRFLTSRETTFDISAPSEQNERGPWIPRSTQVSADLNGVAYDGTVFVAVGKDNTIISSKRGEVWSAVSPTVDLTYSSALVEPVAIGDSHIVLNSGPKYSVGDELLQVLPWNSANLAYVTSVNYVATVDLVGANASPVTNVIPSGSTIEFVDSFGTLKEVTLTSAAAIGTRQLNISTSANLVTGDTVRIKGFNQRIVANLAGIRDYSILLGDTTTNLIASGTSIILDDQVGNVFVVVTDGVTDSGNAEILTTSDLTTLANLALDPTVYLPTIGGLYGQLRSIKANLGLAGSSIYTIQKDTELQFSNRISDRSVGGTSIIYMSSTDKIALQSEVSSESFTAATFSTGGWTNNTSASTDSLRLTIPTSTLSGTVITNMKVIGPTLPSDARVTRTTTAGSLTYIDVAFTATTGVYTRGTTVEENGYYSITLASPLAYDLELGSQLTFDDYSGVTQTLVVDTRTLAGANVIPFITAPGQSISDFDVRVRGFENFVATVDSSTEFYANAVTLTSGAEYLIPAGVTVNFQDTEGNTQYVLREPVDALSANLLFTSNVITDIAGTTVELLSIVDGTTVIEVNTDSNLLLLSTPTVGPITAGANLSVSLDGVLTYIYANSAVATGQSSLTINTVPSIDFVGNVINKNGVQVDTMVSSYTTGTLELDLAANADIGANSVLRLTTSTGYANISVVVANTVAQGTTTVDITTQPAGNLVLANVTLLGIATGTTVSSATGNTAIFSDATTHALPQGTTIEFSDAFGHSVNLATATAYNAGVSSMLFTEPTVASLAGHYVPLNGNAILSFSSVTVTEPGTVVIDKTETSLTLSRPLLANVEIGFDDSLSYGVAGADYYQIRYINDRWVGVGSDSIILLQDEFGNWNQRVAYVYGDLFSVAYGNDTYVAVGSGGLILSSPDLDTWTPQASSTGETFRSIWYYGGQFIAVGDGGYVQSSEDGVLFNDISFTVWGETAQRNLKAIKYLGGQWIAVGEGGTVLLSPDALAWTVYNVGSKSTLTDVNYSQGLYTVIGNRGASFESQDGTSWSERAPGVGTNLLSITSDGFNQLITGQSGIALASSGAYVVDFAVRGISFEMFNNNTVDQLASKGYRVTDGQTLVFAQQEGFDATVYRGHQFENDGWNNYEVVFDSPGYDAQAYEITAITTVLVSNPLPGGANLMVASTLGISTGDYITMGKYTVNDLIQVAEVFDLQGLITTTTPVIASQNDVISFVKQVGFDTKTVVPGYYDNQYDNNVVNRRGGIWQVNVDSNNLVTLSFVRQVNLGQSVMIKQENIKLVYDIALAYNRSTPAYTVRKEELELPKRTTFDGSGTRFSSNRDQYTEPGTLDKYLKFPRLGVFE